MQGGAKVFAKGTIVRLSQKGVDDFLDWWMQLPEITQLIDHWVAREAGRLASRAPPTRSGL